MSWIEFPSPSEVHAGILGWCREMADPDGIQYSDDVDDMIDREIWYFEFGRVVGTWTRKGLKVSMGILAAYAAWKLFRR